MQINNQQLLPPKIKKRRIIRSKGPKAQPEWNDNFSAIGSTIPEYKAYNDVYAAGYMGQLKKHNKYNRYLKEVNLRPGGIRPVKNKA